MEITACKFWTNVSKINRYYDNANKSRNGECGSVVQVGIHEEGGGIDGSPLVLGLSFFGTDYRAKLIVFNTFSALRKANEFCQGRIDLGDGVGEINLFVFGCF